MKSRGCNCLNRLHAGTLILVYPEGFERSQESVDFVRDVFVGVQALLRDQNSGLLIQWAIPGDENGPMVQS